MGTVNKVMLVGWLGKDPELRDNGVCKFSLATDDYAGKDSTKTNWHRITCFGKTAENCAKFLSKGRQVHVEGRIDYSEWEDNGVKKYGTEIIADRVTFLGGKQEQVATEPESGNLSDGDENESDLPF